MTAQQGADTTPDARASRASPRPGGRRRPAARRAVRGLTASPPTVCWGLTGPRLGGMQTKAY